MLSDRRVLYTVRSVCCAEIISLSLSDNDLVVSRNQLVHQRVTCPDNARSRWRRVTRQVTHGRVVTSHCSVRACCLSERTDSHPSRPSGCPQVFIPLRRNIQIPWLTRQWIELLFLPCPSRQAGWWSFYYVHARMELQAFRASPFFWLLASEVLVPRGQTSASQTLGRPTFSLRPTSPSTRNLTTKAVCFVGALVK